MRSARRQRSFARLAAAAAAAVLLPGALAGCQTTQEKAAEHQAEAQRILDARAERQAEGKKAKRKSGKADEPQKGDKQ